MQEHTGRLAALTFQNCSKLSHFQVPTNQAIISVEANGFDRFDGTNQLTVVKHVKSISNPSADIFGG